MVHKSDWAETIGLQALAWIAAEDTVLPLFLAAGGLELQDLRARAGDPVLSGAVLDFILMDDGWVVSFCDAAGLGYDRPLAARQALPGGEVTHWT